MPGRHWVIAKNLLTGDHKILLWWNELYYTKEYSKLYDICWMDASNVMAGEHREPVFEQVGIYESQEQAQEALAKILQS